MASRKTSSRRGFTLIELIVVIVLIGIVAALGARFIDLPVRGYLDLARRTELVDSAELALRRLQREIRAALPNSIRIKPEGTGNGTVLELIPARIAGRYRERPGPGIGHPDCRLQVTLPDASFAVVHDFNSATLGAGDLVVVSNWTTDPTAAANAYTGGNVATVGAFEENAALCGGEDRIGLAPAFKFPYDSTYQRFFVIGAPVAYLCDTAAGTLTRHEGHGLAADQATVDTAAELGGGALVTDHVAGCTMTYDPGSPQRGGMVTLALTLEDQGERIRLLHQVHVVNTP